MTATPPPLPDLGPEWTDYWKGFVHDQMLAYGAACAAAEREACAVAGFYACMDMDDAVRVRDTIRARSTE